MHIRLSSARPSATALGTWRGMGVAACDLLLILAGAALLRLDPAGAGPAGAGPAGVGPVGAVLFLLASALCLSARTALHRGRASAGGGRPEPRLPNVVAEVGRGVILVAVSLASIGWGSPSAQWVVAYAAIASAGLGGISLICSIAVGRRGGHLAAGLAALVGGVVGIVLTGAVHGFDPDIFGTVAILLLGSLLLSRIISVWFDVTVKAGAAERTRS